MQKTDFNRDWTVQKDGSNEILHVNLPDDAMIREDRAALAQLSAVTQKRIKPQVQVPILPVANIFTLKFSIFRKMKPDKL